MNHDYLSAITVHQTETVTIDKVAIQQNSIWEEDYALLTLDLLHVRKDIIAFI